MPIGQDKTQIKVTMTLQEEEILRKKAESEGRTLSNYVYRILLETGQFTSS